MDHIRWDGRDILEKDGLKMLRCVQYGLYERTLIFSLKYNRKTYIAREIGQIMADRLALAEADFDVIVPVPMYAEKERKRGFNQAALIGTFLGRISGKPCLGKALLRTEETRPMRGLSPTERQENVKGKFALNEKYGKMLEKKRVLLIDDFYTTGSTAQECYRQLLKASPQDVLFLAFAAK
jgi:ComF family protein